MTELGYLRAVAAAPAVALADPAANAQTHRRRVSPTGGRRGEPRAVSGVVDHRLQLRRPVLHARRCSTPRAARSPRWFAPRPARRRCSSSAHRGCSPTADCSIARSSPRAAACSAPYRSRRNRTTASSTRSAGSSPAPTSRVTIDDDTFGSFPARHESVVRGRSDAIRDRGLRRPVGARSDRQPARARRRRSDPESVGQHRSHRQGRLSARPRPHDQRPAHLRLSVRVVRTDRVDEGRGVRRSSDRRGERPAARRIASASRSTATVSSPTSIVKSCATTAPSTSRLRQRRARRRYTQRRHRA